MEQWRGNNNDLNDQAGHWKDLQFRTGPNNRKWKKILRFLKEEDLGTWIGL